MGLIRFLLLLVMVILGAAFAMLNKEPVTLNYYYGEYALPLALLLLGTVIVGAILGALFSLPARWRLRRELGEAQRQRRRAEQSLEEQTPAVKE